MATINIEIVSDQTITKDTVRHIANLARLELSDAEVDLFAGQLQDIVGAISVLNEVDTDNVEPTAQVTGLVNVFDADEVLDFVDDKRELLTNVDGEIIDNQILVPPVF